MQAARSSFQRAREGVVGVARRHRPDYQIVLFMGLLMLLGLVVMYAIGPQRAHVLNTSFDTDYYTGPYFFIKQSISLLFALGTFAVMAVVPYSFFRTNTKKILIAGFIACIVLAFAGWIGLGIADCTNGACRWFNLGPLGSLQPAEFLKFGMLLFAASFLGVRTQQGLINDVQKTLLPLGIVALAAIVLIIGIQKDMGTGLALISMLVAMLIMAGLNLRTIGLVGLIGLLLIVFLIIIAPHRMERIT
ncbi:MAG: FtsW/RodA/SpoVE family cell cycle protein, partial [Candidatus Saccharibacteria bacterium]